MERQGAHPRWTSTRRWRGATASLLALWLAGCGAATPPLPALEAGCDGAQLLARPTDPSARGPWAVGVRTVDVGGLTTEVWYPARWGSESGQAKVRYDLRQQLPESEQGKIPDAKAPRDVCDCYRDLPLDDARGPYPVVVFLHGFAAFRTQSLALTTHWASRGFVVVAADHPGLRLGDVLSARFNGDQTADAEKLLDALAAPAGGLAFLRGRLATARMAVAGHSAGGMTTGKVADRAGLQVRIAMAAGGTVASPSLVSTLVLGGGEDATVPYPRQQSGYESSPVRKRLVGLARAGHLAFSDLCVIGRENGGILQLATTYEISGAGAFAPLATDGCKDGQLAAEEGWHLVNVATAAALEETLQCTPARAAALQALATHPGVQEYRERL